MNVYLISHCLFSSSVPLLLHSNPLVLPLSIFFFFPPSPYALLLPPTLLSPISFHFPLTLPFPSLHLYPSLPVPPTHPFPSLPLLPSLTPTSSSLAFPKHQRGVDWESSRQATASKAYTQPPLPSTPHPHRACYLPLAAGL